MKPMLLERKNPDVYSLRYPIYGSPKLDGIRCIGFSYGIRTRTLKPVPNKFINRELGISLCGGLDGELIVGSPTDPNVFNTTTSAVRREDGQPDFTYYVFDMWDSEHAYGSRIAELEYVLADLHPRVKFLPSTILDTPEELLQFEEQQLSLGYEGIILRSPLGVYKYGRTTMKEHNAFKLKRFVDGEAYVIDMVEKLHNTNEEFTNELGRTARSKKAEGMVALATMGALVVKDKETDVEFNIGSGFSDVDRLWWYRNWVTVANNRTPIVYKKFLIGEKDKPRHPIFKGIRMVEDL